MTLVTLGNLLHNGADPLVPGQPQPDAGPRGFRIGEVAAMVDPA
jgi:hypothetical protein